MPSENNPCKGCVSNCCARFKLTEELRNPEGIQSQVFWLKGPFKYIRRIGWESVALPDGRKRRVGVYRCDLWDRKSGECTDHDNRPEFCKNTGKGGRYPNNHCLLKNRIG